MGHVVTFAHHKGGTGKTTTCVNVAGFAVKQRRRVLVVDLDPQANATSGLGVDTRTVEASMLDVITGTKPLTDVLLQTECGVHLAPSCLDLVGAEPWLYQLPDGRLTRVAQSLDSVKDRYDLILIDTPPGAGILMLNGLAAADEVVATLDPGVFALEDLRALQTILGDVASAVGRERHVAAAVVTRVLRPRWWDRLLGRPDTQAQVVHELRQRFQSCYVVPYDATVFESQRLGLPLSHLGPGSPAGRSYQHLAREVMNHG